jgi:dolichyl-phosphate-mannose--protein O-mannosyl transferase
MGDSLRTVPDVLTGESGFLNTAASAQQSSTIPASGASGRRGILRNPVLIATVIFFVAWRLFFAGIRIPANTYYDEGSYVESAKAFLIGEPNPNRGSPPLGQMLIAAGIQEFGDNPLGWRIAGSAFGALALSAVFLWTFLLTRNLGLAAISAALTLSNNFLFVMSRLAMLDVFLVCFIFWGLVAYTAALELDVGAGQRRILLCCAGALLGLAAGCKVNAVDTLAVLALVSGLLLWIPKRFTVDSNAPLSRYSQNLRQAGFSGIAIGLVASPPISYSLVFWPLFHRLQMPFGMRELAQINVFMWHFKTSAVCNVAIASSWYTWPFHVSPQRGLSYLLGNPVVMWGGVASLVFSLRRIWRSLAVAETMLLLLYTANLLQWSVTPMKATFYYYYFPAAMFLGVAVALFLRRLPRTVLGIHVGTIVLVAAAVVFLWCLPRMAHLEAPWDCALGCWN